MKSSHREGSLRALLAPVSAQFICLLQDLASFNRLAPAPAHPLDTATPRHDEAVPGDLDIRYLLRQRLVMLDTCSPLRHDRDAGGHGSGQDVHRQGW